MAEKEYIEREDALSAQNKSMNLSECRKRLERIPAADVRPVPEGGIRDEQKAQIIAMAAEDKPRWIPVTERLPEQEKQVLVTGIEAIGNVQIYGVKQLDGDVWRPTSAPSCYWEHWMPLPQPPEEE